MRQNIPETRVSDAISGDVDEAYTAAGGVEYLVRLAKRYPRTFAQLLARKIPQRLEHDIRQVTTVRIADYTGRALEAVTGPPAQLPAGASGAPEEAQAQALERERP